jgi:putative DNA primase/helicase
MGKFYISVGTSVNCTKWENITTTWEEFTKRFEIPVKTQETVEAYHKMIKVQKDRIKDIGGYVGGYLNKGSRKINHVRDRTLISLDLDSPVMGIIPHIKYRGLLHTTHSHTIEEPRYRIIIPLKEKLSSEEYTFIARYIAKEIGVFDEYADKTTYQANRLMFWPSCPSDGEYIVKTFKGVEVDGRAILDKNPNWVKEVFSEIPQKDMESIGKLIKKKQMDPTQKKGVIGAFCKAYPIIDCIENFLSDKYLETDVPDRYTWSEGSTHGGVLIFEGLYTYSFHDTDPTSMRLCNAYDLVRLTKFKGDEKTALTFCAAQDGVGAFLAEEEFGEEFEVWQKQLEYTKNGDAKATMSNLELILANTYDLSFNDFKKQPMLNGLPYKNKDDSKIMSFVESKYGIYNESKIKRAVEVVSTNNTFHPIRDYLDKLVWDGVPRIDNLLIDYFHANDNPFTKESIRLTLLAGVMRIYEPGCEAQHILILRGKTGIGKSSFFRNLCPKPEYFSDSLTLYDTRDSKTGGEHLLGNWIIELPEMAGMKKGDVESIKSFITRQVDKFRPAFGRVLEDYPRECLFFGSTNDAYLQDLTGNRRYWTIMCEGRFQDTLNRDQIWAEAKHLYEQISVKSIQEKQRLLQLSPEALKISLMNENENLETDDRTNFILQFIERKIPENWYDKTTYDRIQYLTDELSPVEGKGLVNRSWITTSEIWCELYQNRKSDLKRSASNEILKSLRSLGYTERFINLVNDINYGRSIGYKKPTV